MRQLVGIFIGALVLVVGLRATLSMSVNCRLASEEVSDRVLPTIVQIGVTIPGTNNVYTTGSGVVVREDGYVLTAKHNVGSSLHVFVKLHDGTAFPARYFIADAHRDLAVLKIDLPPDTRLAAISLGGNVRVGQDVVVFGFPAHSVIGGLAATVSKGVVSATDRNLQDPAPLDDEAKGSERREHQDEVRFRVSHAQAEDIDTPVRIPVRKVIQIDAMMNPGSSGGAVTDMDGRLVAIASSMVSNTGSNVGLNFAIPVAEARTILSVIFAERSETP